MILLLQWEWPIRSCILSLSYSFISSGTSILVAQNLGAKNKMAAKEISAVSLVINALFGVILSFLIFIFGESLLKVMSLPSYLRAEAESYLTMVGGLSFLEALFMTASAILRSNGFTRDVMYITVGMNILNVAGNYLFIFGPFGFPILRVEGVEISTVISRFIGFAAVMIILIWRLPGWIKFKQLLAWPKHHVANLLKIGIPTAGEHLSYEGSQVVITLFVAMIGTEALTAKIYAQNNMAFIYLFSLSVALGNQIIIGHNIGAKEYGLAYIRCLKSRKQSMLVTLITAVLFTLFSRELIGIFTNNEEILQVGSLLILLIVLLEPGRSINLVVINSLRVAGDVKFPVYQFSPWGG